MAGHHFGKAPIAKRSRRKFENYLLAVRRAAVTGVPFSASASSTPVPAAASASRASAGRDFEPVFFMIEAR